MPQCHVAAKFNAEKNKGKESVGPFENVIFTVPFPMSLKDSIYLIVWVDDVIFTLTSEKGDKNTFSSI